MKKENVRDFFTRHKRAVLAVFSVIFIFLALTTVGRELDEAATDVAVIGESELLASPMFGLSVTETEGGKKLFTPTDGDPQLYLSIPNPSFNKIVISFGDFEYGGSLQLYYSADGQLSEPNSRIIKCDGEREAVIFLPEGFNIVARLDPSEPIMIESVRFVYSEFSATTVLNRAPLVTMLLLAALLVALEYFVGYFKAVRDLFRERRDALRIALAEGRRLEFALLVTALALGFLFAASAALIIMLDGFYLGLKIYLFWLGATAIAAYFAYSFVSGKTETARLVFVAMLVISVVLSVSLPATTYTSWDDEYHYKSTATWANVLFGMKYSLFDQNQMNMKYGMVGEYDEMKFLVDEHQSASGSIGFGTDIIKAPVKFISNIPGGAVMALTRALGVSAYSSCVWVKLSGAFIYTALVYFAIKKLKSGKLIFASVTMLPTALFLAANYSCDWWINGFAAYGIASYIQALQEPEQPLTVSGTLKMLGAMLISSLPKAIYVFLVAVMLFMPREKFAGENKAKWRYRASVLATVVLAFLPTLVSFFGNPDSMTDNRGGEGIDAPAQLAFILSEPIAYLRILLKFLLEYISFGTAATYTVSLSYLGFGAGIFGTASVILMLFAAFTDKSDRDVLRRGVCFKTWAWLVFAGMAVLIATALYISYTPVQHPTVNGCQYRYIIPLLFVALYVLSPAKIRHNLPEGALSVAFLSALSVNALFTFYDLYLVSIL